MQLIGMLDSPYVRRVAISFEALGVAFEHRAVSVFSTFELFQSINPVVKAPSLICDDGQILMDSSLILQLAENKSSNKSLWSKDTKEFQHQLTIVGLALAACEKSVQIIYERNWRPQEFQYEAWVNRVTGQLLAAYKGLEEEIKQKNHIFTGPLNQASITSAVAWQFTQSLLASIVPTSNHPGLNALSSRLEQTPEFKKYPPVGPGVPKNK